MVDEMETARRAQLISVWLHATYYEKQSCLDRLEKLQLDSKEIGVLLALEPEVLKLRGEITELAKVVTPSSPQ